VNAAVWIFLGLSAVVAAGDWLAVARRQKSLEYVCKPLTIALLIGVAVTLDVDDGTVRVWFVAGLASFLLAHVAYIVGLWVDGQSALWFGIGVGVAALAWSSPTTSRRRD
jgi:uncharacterized membrane protein YhhN